jgi:hypothetical protein
MTISFSYAYLNGLERLIVSSLWVVTAVHLPRRAISPLMTGGRDQRRISTRAYRPSHYSRFPRLDARKLAWEIIQHANIEPRDMYRQRSPAIEKTHYSSRLFRRYRPHCVQWLYDPLPTEPHPYPKPVSEILHKRYSCSFCLLEIRSCPSSIHTGRCRIKSLVEVRIRSDSAWPSILVYQHNWLKRTDLSRGDIDSNWPLMSRLGIL